MGNGMLLLLYIAIFCCCSFSSTADEQTVTSFQTLQEVVSYLRADDERVVRPSPTELTAERQETEACGKHLEQSYQVLVQWYQTDKTAKPGPDVLDAIRVITLCTTDRPDHRAKLTISSHGSAVPEALVALLEPTSNPSESAPVVAVVAECIWISSFASRVNHEALGRPGTVHALTEIITDWNCTNVSRDTKNECFLAQMWSAAALQNLGAAYCVTDDGRCDWEWKQGDDFDEEEEEVEWEDGRAMIGLKGDGLATHDPKHIRLQLMRNAKLLETLEDIICDLAENMLGSLTRVGTWPSRATLSDDEYDSFIIPWAAIGLVKTLALSPGFFERLSKDMVWCLCEFSTLSPDWLEAEKASDTIYRLGMNKEDVCTPPYDPEECVDFAGWKDGNGGTCKQYEEERWCTDFGNEMGTTDKGEELPAKEACCICDGGHDVGDDDDDDGFEDEF